MNHAAFAGHLTDDPARRDTTAGVVTTFRLAVHDGRHRLWIDVEAWGHLAGSAATHLSKGRLIAVTGKLRNRPYTQNGQRRDYWHLLANDISYLDSGRRTNEDDGPEVQA